jgi:hypothetical protein
MPSVPPALADIGGRVNLGELSVRSQRHQFWLCACLRAYQAWDGCLQTRWQGGRRERVCWQAIPMAA